MLPRMLSKQSVQRHKRKSKKSKSLLLKSFMLSMLSTKSQNLSNLLNGLTITLNFSKLRLKSSLVWVMYPNFLWRPSKSLINSMLKKLSFKRLPQFPLRWLLLNLLSRKQLKSLLLNITTYLLTAGVKTFKLRRLLSIRNWLDTKKKFMTSTTSPRISSETMPSASSTLMTGNQSLSTTELTPICPNRRGTRFKRLTPSPLLTPSPMITSNSNKTSSLRERSSLD